MHDLGFPQETIEIYEDNQACIALTKNPEDHKRTKHIQVKYHVVRDYVKKNLVKFVYCPTENQLADIFTKALPGSRLRTILAKLGLSRRGENQKLVFAQSPNLKSCDFTDKLIAIDKVIINKPDSGSL